MTTLRPNDFFLNEDAPASIVQTSGLMTVEFQNSPDCAINSVVVPDPDWSGDTVRLRLRMRSDASNASNSATFRVKLFAWPSAPSSDGPVSGVENVLTVALFSPNPAVIRSGQLVLEVPDGYTPDMALSISIAIDPSLSTEGILPRMVAAEYEFV